MFQEILESQNNIFTLSNGTICQAFKVNLFDQDISSSQDIENCLSQLINSITPLETLKVYLNSRFSVESSEHSRTEAIQNIGYIENKTVIVLEKYPELNLRTFFSKETANSKLSDIKSAIANLDPKPLSKSEFQSFLPLISDEVTKTHQTLDNGTEVLSLMRVSKLSEFGLTMETLSQVKESLPIPYTICCSVQRISDSEAELLLQRKSKQTSEASSLKESRKHQDAEEYLESVTLNGAKLFRFEWQILINRSTESKLRTDREEIKRKLTPLGEIYIESVGLLPSLRSFYPGEKPHFTMIEKDSTLITYMPLITEGASSKPIVTDHSLILHRRDESLSSLDIFNKNYDSYSWTIFGKTGTGKSVLTNSITRALYSDPNIKIIKIDVGGSHSNETKLLGGVEKRLSINEPTGLNPFDILTELGNSLEARQILLNCLETLILEEDETKLTKEMKSNLENSVAQYCELGIKDPSLESFYRNIKSIPRKSILRRWVDDGVYSNAFRKLPGQEDLNSKLTYFNFANINQALDPDYAQGGLAAVMARFNIEMLKKAKDKKRIVFIADETPFFIKKCFNFFNLSIANIRKEGHGFITIAQNTRQVVVNGDTGILDNSPNQIYFSSDSSESEFLSRTRLDESAYQKIQSLQQKRGEFSECMLRDKFGERILRIRLSKEEYWSYTSKDEDKQKFKELSQACPTLTTKEIIRCLSFS